MGRAKTIHMGGFVTAASPTHANQSTFTEVKTKKSNGLFLNTTHNTAGMICSI